MPQLLNDLQIVHDLLDSHFIESSNLQVALIRVCLPYDLAADDQEQSKAYHPAHLGCFTDACKRQALRFVQRAWLTEYVEVIEEPVEHIEAARDNVGDLQEAISVAIEDDLDTLKLEERLEDAEKLACLTYTLYIKVVSDGSVAWLTWYEEVVDGNGRAAFKIEPAAELSEVLKQLHGLVATLYNNNKFMSNLRDLL